MGVYEKKRAVFVVPFNGSTISYGFQTNIDNGDSATLGHKSLSAAVTPVVFGASRPKPARLKRDRLTGSTSSFVDWQNYEPLIAGGSWKRTRGCKYPADGYQSQKAIRLVAEVAPQISVAFDMKKTQYARVQASLAGLGIEILNNQNGKQSVYRQNKIEGVSMPGVKKRDGENILSISYVDYKKLDNLPEGWSRGDNASENDPSISPAFL